MSEESKITTTVSVSRKVNTGNYESADLFVAISGITEDTTPDEMDWMLDQGKIAYSKIADRIREQTTEIRKHKEV